VLPLACADGSGESSAAPGGEPPATVVREELDGGGHLLMVVDPSATRVEGAVRFAAGSAHEPAGRAGLTEVLADALQYGGPMQRSGLELHDRLAARDASLEIAAGTEFVSFDFSCPPQALDEALAAVGDLVRHPHYPPEFVDRARERVLERLATEARDPASVADQVLLDEAYGPDAPFTRTPTFESVEAVERDDLLAFHRSSFGSARMWVGVTGPLPAAEVRAAVAGALADLPAVGPAPTVDQPPFRSLEQRYLVLIEVPGAERTEIRVGAPGVSIDDPDYPALRLWSDVHGNAADSRSELASETFASGLTDRMGAFFRPRWSDPGEFLAYATTDSESPHRALGRLSLWIADATLSGEAGALLQDDVLTAARDHLRAAETRAAGGRERLERLLDLDAHDRPRDFWERNFAELRATGAERLRAAADRHAAQVPWLVVVAFPPGVEPTIPGSGTTTRRSAAFAPRGTADGLAMLATAFDALGGIERWAGVRCLYLEGDVHTNNSERPVGVRIWRDLDGPRLRLVQRGAEAAPGDDEVVRIATPDGAWVATENGLQPLPDEVRRSVEFREARQLPRVLHDLATDRALSVSRRADRLEVARWGRLLCWMRLGADGRPNVLGYPPTESERQGESEFRSWLTTADGLVLPEEVAEPTLGRSFLWTAARTAERFEDELFER